uniref:hypothetical protein n=1 Tax=Paludisphaera rhizosphaerae TaxID=2711216 RepID=UPI00197FAAD9
AGFPSLMGMGGLGAIGGIGATVMGARNLIDAGLGKPFGLGEPTTKAQGFAGLAQAGSREAYSTILRTRYGGEKDPVAENTRKVMNELVGLRKDFKQGFKIKEGMPTSPELIEI